MGSLRAGGGGDPVLSRDAGRALRRAAPARRHREDVASLLARELGHPVEIDAIATSWDGWNPAVTVRGLRVRDRAGAAAQR